MCHLKCFCRLQGVSKFYFAVELSNSEELFCFLAFPAGCRSLGILGIIRGFSKQAFTSLPHQTLK
jgi:hypothetical protein